MPGILALSSSFFCLKLATAGIYYWYPTYLQEELGMTKSKALDVFSYFSSGSFLGMPAMGLVSDILPIRSPIFEVGILVSTLLLLITTNIGSGSISFAAFCMGATIYGSEIIIAAIECDIGNFVKLKYELLALGTFSGMIDGFASLG
jgi:sugar phosphate permease